MTVPNSYLTTVRNVEPMLAAIQRAAVPERFSQQFLKQLGFPSSNDRPIIPLFKAMRFLDDSGVPTDRYRRFRDPTASGAVLAEGLREAYEGLFAINQRASETSLPELRGVFARLTGKHEGVVEKMASTFKALARNADFTTSPTAQPEQPVAANELGRAGPSALSADLAEIHPLILGLLRELPPAGEAFPADKQRAWLEIAQTAFRLMYSTDAESPKSTIRARGPDKAPDREEALRTE
jgi:hypothetical protein